jgi:hypothetical protein
VIYNGSTITKVMHNGVVITKGIYNGTSVYSSSTELPPPQEGVIVVRIVTSISTTVPYATPESELALPEIVICDMSDGTRATKAVTWSCPTYSPITAGTYTFRGDVEDTDIDALAYVTVQAQSGGSDELVINGTFGTVGDTAGWGLSSPAHFSVIGGQLKHVATANYEYAWQDIHVSGGTEYIAKGTSTGGGINIHYINSAGSIISSVYAIHLNPDNHITTPAGTIKLRFQLTNNTNISTAVYYDNISLTYAQPK